MVALPDPRQPTLEAIYAAYEARAETGFRRHLGASLIGGSCSRALWYTFRHCTRATFPGRILRLFETGHREEARIIANLRSTGATVLDADPDTGRQWTLSEIEGHFGGSMDAVAVGLLESQKWHVCEFKTHGIKSFKALKESGVQKSKPMHYAQMVIYMHLSDLTRAMYVAVCKDTDELYIERIKENPDFAKSLLEKARNIIYANEPPQGISQKSTWFECKFCDHALVCHEKQLPDRNCRTCVHSAPIANGEWSCGRFGSLRQNCAGHAFIPELVNGEQIDAAEDGAWIEYRMNDGTTWVDGEK